MSRQCLKSHVKHWSSQFASSRYVSAEPEFPTLVGVEVQGNFYAYPSLTYVNGRILVWPLQVGGRASKHSFHPFHPGLVDFVSSNAQTSKEIIINITITKIFGTILNYLSNLIFFCKFIFASVYIVSHPFFEICIFFFNSNSYYIWAKKDSHKFARW